MPATNDGQHPEINPAFNMIGCLYSQQLSTSLSQTGLLNYYTIIIIIVIIILIIIITVI